MAKHCAHIDLHTILRRAAESQMLYAYVVGVIDTNPGITAPKAIRMFRDRFNVQDLDIKAALTKFHRMRHEALQNNKIFDNNETRKKQSNGYHPTH